MVDHGDEERRYRSIAEKMRVRGEMIDDPYMRAQYLRVATTYERLAESEMHATTKVENVPPEKNRH